MKYTIVPQSYMLFAWSSMLHSMVRFLKRSNTAVSLWDERIKRQNVSGLIISTLHPLYLG